MEIRDAQVAVWNNKLAKGFNVTDPFKEIAFLHGEVSEAHDAIRKDLDELPGEIADIIAFALSLASMHGIDADAAVQAKLAENEGRSYVKNGNGELVKSGE